MAQQNQNTRILKNVEKEQLEHAASISILQNKVDDLEAGIQRVLFLLENDNKTGSEGVIAQVRKNTKFRDDFKSKTTMLGMVGGALTGIAFWILKLIFKQV